MSLRTVANAVAFGAERMLTRWTRNAFLWRYPLIAILLEALFFLSIYVLSHGIGGGSWFALVLLLLSMQALLAVVFLGVSGFGFWRRHFKLALAALLGAVVLGATPWSSRHVGPPLQEAFDKARFYAVRGSYDAIIARMPPEVRSSRVTFFDWGESGFAGTTTFYWIVYDESGEIGLPDSEQSTSWKEQVYPLNRIVHSSRCQTRALRLSGHFYSVSTHC